MKEFLGFAGKLRDAYPYNRFNHILAKETTQYIFEEKHRFDNNALLILSHFCEWTLVEVNGITFLKSAPVQRDGVC